MGTDVSADLTDVTLADEDINSILTDNANRAIQGNVALHCTMAQALNKFGIKDFAKMIPFAPIFPLSLSN